MERGKGFHLVLDWDDTLAVCCQCQSHEHASAATPHAHVQIQKRNLYFRPGLFEFLHFAFQRFETVSIWTHSGEKYITECIEHLRRVGAMPESAQFHRVLHNAHALRDYPDTIFVCHEDDVVFYKPLAPAGFDMHKTIIVDDTSKNARYNRANAITIPAYEPCSAEASDVLDDALLKLQTFLERELLSARKVSELLLEGRTDIFQ